MKCARRELSRFAPGGFTLVELLVVIAIIGMLVGLVLPAVQSARERGRNTVCKSNMRQVALAVINYENSKNKYPGYVDLFRHQDQNLYRRPLMVLLLPYLDRRDLADEFAQLAAHIPYNPSLGGPDWRTLWQSKYPNFEGLTLEILNCPSDSVNLPRHTAYVYNTGTAPNWLGGPPGQNPADGVFLWNGNPSNPQIMTADRIYDGQENTIMITENIQARYWTDGDEGYVGCVWWDVPLSSLNTVLSVNQEKTAGVEPLNAIGGAQRIRYARPASYHPGGVNVAYCDGHVAELNEGIDYVTYAHLMTSKGRSCTAQSNGTVGYAVRNSVLNKQN